MPLNWVGLNSFILIAFLAGGIDGNNKDKGGQANPDLSEMIGGFLEGMQAALGQMQKPDGTSGGGQQQDPMAGIKNLVDSIDPDQINKFIKGMASPDSLFDWIPAKFRGILPEEWRNKLGEVLVSELDNLAKVWEAAANFKSGGDLWAELKGKTPTLAGLLEEIWEAALKKWAEFEGALEPEAKEYIEKVKSSFGNFISHQLLGPFGQLSGEAKWNLRVAFEKAFPLLEPMVTKAVQSEGLGKWAEELGGKSSASADEKEEKTKEGEEETKEEL